MHYPHHPASDASAERSGRTHCRILASIITPRHSRCLPTFFLAFHRDRTTAALNCPTDIFCSLEDFLAGEVSSGTAEQSIVSITTLSWEEILARRLVSHFGREQNTKYYHEQTHIAAPAELQLPGALEVATA
jgi:hypothetical protein